MREILFRGKRFDNGDFVEGYLVKDMFSPGGGATFILNPTYNWSFYRVYPETVDQFAGKFDKNYRKIFEGDIVRAMMDYGPAGMLPTVVSICWDNSVGGWNWGYFDMSTIEVIGNIHDDTDLLCLERSNTHV